MTHLQCHVEPVVLLRPRRRLRDDHQLRDLPVVQLVRLGITRVAAAPPVVLMPAAAVPIDDLHLIMTGNAKENVLVSNKVTNSVLYSYLFNIIY